ncbi:MAG: PAS-domain containing protein [Alphaproteobacteria bacterium]|nr:PAS-domain containing protein [Alphaproteobacteria bacterium]
MGAVSQYRAKKSAFSTFLDPLTGADMLRREKARLEAFLSAVPGEYCGFSADGSAAYSEKFLSLLNLTRVENIHDIQTALSTSDAAVLEGQFFRLKETGQTFQITVTSQDGGRVFRLTGSKGSALDGGDSFDILWLEDVTDAEKTLTRLRQDVDIAGRDAKELQSTLDALPLPLWRRGGDGKLLWSNQHYARLMGLTPAEVIAQQKDLPCTPKDKALDHLTLSRKALETGETQGADFHAIIAGQRHLLHKKETPLPLSHATIGLALDRTEQEKIYTEMLRYQSANQQLLEQLRTAIAIFAADQRLEFFNSAFAALWSLDETWLHKKPKLGDILEKLREIRKLPEQSDFRRYKQGWLDLFTRLMEPFEDMMYLPDGSALRLLAMAHPMGGLMITFDDVTSRLELESSYNTLVAVQKETLDNLAEGVVAFGGDGRLRLYNPAFASLWHLNPEELDNTPHISRLAGFMARLFTAEEAEGKKDILISHALNRTPQVARLLRRDGSLVEYATVPLPDGGMLVSYVDVTDNVRVENALREKNAALEAAEQLKTDFLANVSYQLRTPLSSIMGFAEILQHEYFGALNPKQKEYTTDIQSAGRRLVSLIDDILDLSTLEAGYMELHKTPIQVPELLRSVHNLTEDWAHKQKLMLQLNIPRDTTPLNGDERRIKQILINLIRNAITHTPAGGTVTLSATKTDQAWILSVQDTGVGIAPEWLGRVFEPFERGTNGTITLDQNAPERGAGLGLTLVKNIAELHGGRVTAESTLGTGSLFSIILPLT